MKNVIIAVAGVALGVCIWKIIHDNISKKNDVNNPPSKKDFYDIFDENVFIDDLQSGELIEWFKQNDEIDRKYGNKVKRIVSYLTSENISKLGLPKELAAEYDHHIIQVFYDEKSEKILKTRLVAYANIDYDLRELLDKSGGTVIISGNMTEMGV